MAAASSSLGTQFHEELSCSICLELFTRPKVLPCQHTFCQDCLQNHAGRGRTFQCPNCREEVEVPPQGVAGLPDNHLVTSLCERLQKQATLSGETKEQPESRCSSHPSEEVRLYCKQCCVPVCNECLDEIHSDHGTITLKKALEERRAPVQALIVEGRNILETFCTSLRSLREREKALDEKKQKTDNSIIHAYEQDVQKVTEKKDHLLSQVEEKHTKNKEVLQEERERVLADVNELSAACDRAEQELQQGRVKFLNQQTALTEVVGKYRGKAAPTPVQTQPAVFQPTDTTALTVTIVAWLFLLAALLLCNPPYWLYNATFGQFVIVQPISKMITFGGRGSGTGQFKDPRGVTVSDEGEIFVADRGNQRIQVFTLQGTFVRQFLTHLRKPGYQRINPTDVAMDGEGNLWVVGGTVSAETDAVQYNKQGRVLRKFDLQKTERERGVAVDTRRNHILITQTTGHWPNLHGEVQVFRPDGTLVRTVGQQQGMKHPGYITVDREGNILVSDWYNNCIYVYNEDGQFLFQFEGEGSGEGQLNIPHGICTDRAGNIIVADTGNSRVKMFDKTGKFLKHITTDMKRPHAVAMATLGQLVVTDSVENFVHIIHTD